MRPSICSRGDGGDAKVLSGGQSLLPLLKLRLGTVGTLVDLRRVPGLSYIKEEGGRLRIGGATRECELERSELVRTKYPLLFDTALVIADPLVRNRATVGGNLAHGDPANDHPATMLAYGAEIVARGPKGERTIAVGGFLPRPLRDRAGRGRDPDRDPDPGAGGAVRRRLLQAGAQGRGLRHGGGRGAAHARRGRYGAVGRDRPHQRGRVPVQAVKAETFLKGKKPSARGAGGSRADSPPRPRSPTADWKGSVEYKRNVTRVLATRALAKAIERAGGK